MSTDRNKFAAAWWPSRNPRSAARAARVALFALLLVVASVPAVAIGRQSSVQETDSDAEATWLESILTEPSAVDIEVRRGAAARLLSTPRRSALAALERAVSIDRREVHAAVVEAMAASALWPTPLVDRMSSRLPALLADAASTPTTRAAVAAALGRVPTAASLEALVRALADFDPARADDRRVADAAIASLERLTRRQFGNDRQGWVDWWQENRERPLEELLEPSVEALRGQLERSRATERSLRDEVDQLHQRLAGIQTELLLQLPPDLRQERIVRLLADPVAAVRRVAIDHVERSFPSAQIPGEAVHAALVATLADPVPAHRTAAAKLLDRINRPRLGEQVAARFVEETDPDTLVAYLAILQRLPTPAAEPRLLDLALRAGATPRGIADDAARALVAHAEAGILSDGASTRVRAALRPAMLELFGGTESELTAQEEINVLATVPGPGALRLFTAVCDEDDLAQLVELLSPDRPDSTRLDGPARRSIAEGLRFRQQRDALLALADDDAVYPALMRSLSETDVNLERLRAIVRLVPDASEAENGGRGAEWRRAVVRAMNSLPTGDLNEADELLEALQRDTTANGRVLAVRREALTRIAEVRDDALPPADLARLVRRAATVELESGNPAEASRLLDRLAGDDSEATRRLRFRSRALAADYVAAMELSAEPSWWIDLLTWSVEHRLFDSAAVLLDEITRVFIPNDALLTPAHADQIAAARREVQRHLPSAAVLDPAPPESGTDPQAADERVIGESVTGEWGTNFSSHRESAAERGQSSGGAGTAEGEADLEEPLHRQ